MTGGSAEAIASPTSAEDAGARRRYRLIYLTLLGILPLQFAFSKLVSEPYPAIMMPAFAAPRSDSSATFRSVDIDIECADGSSKTLSPRQFFSTIPDDHAWDLTVINFSPPSDSPGAGGREGAGTGWKRWLKRNLFAMQIEHDRIAAMADVPEETRRWLETFARSDVGAAQPVRVIFRWYTYHVDPDDPGRRAAAGERIVNFDSVSPGRPTP